MVHKKYRFTMMALGLLCFSGLEAFPAVETQPVFSPAPMRDFLPVVIVNHTKQPSSEVYITMTALDPNGTPCFLKPDPASGICSYQYPNADGTNGSVANSIPLSQLPQTQRVGLNPAYGMYLPICSSARSYYSIGAPMYLSTTYSPSTGGLAINSPAPNSLNDPNIWTPYQDFEFGVNLSKNNSSTDVYMNVSYVDYFCIPYRLSVYSYQGNKKDFEIAGTASGMPAGSSQTSVLAAVNKILNPEISSDYPNQNTWGALAWNFYESPYYNSSNPGVVRLLAAKNSTAPGRTFQGGDFTTNSFPSDYLTNPSVGPATSSGQSYMEGVYQYYLASNKNTYAPLWAVITPAAGTILYNIYSDPGTDGQLNFDAYQMDGVTRIPSDDTNVNLNSIALADFLSGNITFANGFTNASPIGAELGKLLSALFDTKQFPLALTTSNTKPFYNAFNYKSNGVDHGGYTDLKYFPPSTIYTNQPAYNLYDQAFHFQELGAGTLTKNPLLGIGYAYDYDDLLGMDGTIPGLTIQNTYGNPSEASGAESPYIVMVLGDMNGTIPNLADTNYYTVTIGSAPNGASVVFSYSGGSTTAPISGTTTIGSSIHGASPISGDSSDYLHATFTFNGISYVFNINLLGQVVIPTTGGTANPLSTDYPTYSAADVQYQSNFSFSVTAGHQGTASDPIPVTITFDSSPPGWEG